MSQNTTTEHQHDHTAAVGGFWIAADGSSIPVEDACQHDETISGHARREGWDTSDYCGYDAAYVRGFVRVTFCEKGVFGASWNPYTATVQALRELAKIMRHHAEHRSEARVEGDRLVTDEEYALRDGWKDRHNPGRDYHIRQFPSLYGNTREVANQVMQIILRKNAEAKREASPQGELDLLAGALAAHGLPPLSQPSIAA